MRLALVTEGMIHRSIDDLMDWLDAAAPAVRDLDEQLQQITWAPA